MKLRCRSCDQVADPGQLLEVTGIVSGAVSYVHRPSLSDLCFHRVGPRSLETIRMIPRPDGRSTTNADRASCPLPAAPAAGRSPSAWPEQHPHPTKE